MATIIDFRCDANPRRLFAKLLSTDAPRKVDTDNLMCFACRDCRRELGANGQRPKDVIHRFALDGVLVDTVIVEQE